MAEGCEVFDAGDVPLQSGRVFPAMKLAYRTYGRLNAARDNVVIYPTSFSAQHSDIDWLAGAFDLERRFVVIPDLFCNGLSSSPSNTDHGAEGFPAVTLHDAVAVQHRLMTEVLGVRRVALAYGWSMGGMQAYHWATLYPEMVERAAIVCGAARCSPYNHVFLEGVKATLRAAKTPEQGLRAMGRVYAGWAMSHPFYQGELWRDLGFTSLEDYLVRAWEPAFLKRDPENLMGQIGIWQAGDISACERFGGDIAKAMAAIKAHILLMPCETDAYFRVQDNAAEAPLLINAASVALKPIPSPRGHRAGNPMTLPVERAFLEREIAAFLER